MKTSRFKPLRNARIRAALIKRRARRGRLMPKRRGIHPFHRTSAGCYDLVNATTVLNLVSSSSAAVYGCFIFRLSDLPDYSEYCAMFDQYRIVGVKLTFFPQQTDASVGIGATTPIIHTAIDRNDGGGISTEANFLQYDQVKTHKFDRQFSIYIKPKVDVVVWNNNVASGYATGSPWLSTSYPSIQYFGLKYLIPQVSSSNNAGWRIYAKYYLAMKDLI